MIATGVARVACCHPVAVSLVKDDTGQEGAAAGPQVAHMRAGVPCAFVKPDARDVAIDTRLEFQAQLNRLGIRGQRPRRVWWRYSRCCMDTQGQQLVVKDQVKSALRALPATSFTPADPPFTVALYVVPLARGLFGVKVAVVPAL